MVPWKRWFVSSAKKMYFKLGDAVSKSLIKIKKSRGPWGLPFFRVKMKN